MLKALHLLNLKKNQKIKKMTAIDVKMNWNSDALRLFKALRLFFLPNFTGPTFIPCPTSINIFLMLKIYQSSKLICGMQISGSLCSLTGI